MNKKIENSIRSLVNLYTFVVGVALSVAIVTLINPEKGLQSVTLSSAMLFLAFIATLFPFYHGALRHLDDAYLENETNHIRDGALIVDFLLLFLHALGFVVLSLLLGKPGHFAWVLCVLLSVDVLWGAFAYFGSSSRTNVNAESKWAIINFIFVLVGICYLVDHDIGLTDVAEPFKLALLIAVACFIRSLMDYIWCSTFYFPRD